RRSRPAPRQEVPSSKRLTHRVENSVCGGRSVLARRACKVSRQGLTLPNGGPAFAHGSVPARVVQPLLTFCVTPRGQYHDRKFKSCRREGARHVSQGRAPLVG